ncbi:MAG: hypothetical protein KatS3mg060_1690 [Dehalococcoidia bacterium]|nr:MAG: hypothetical protein KatS3mg060_1690 [Dehalococcoidia bacterium]
MTPLRTLVLTPPGPHDAAMIRALERFRDRLDLRQASLVDGVPDLTGVQVVVAHLDGIPLSLAECSALLDFATAGGGLVTVGDRGVLLGVGNAPLSPECEVVITCPIEHPITDRLDRRFTVVDAVALLPDDAPGDVVLQLHWQYQRLPLAVVRTLGRGRLVSFALQGRAAALGDPSVQRLLFRSVRFAAQQAERHPIGAGLIGWGAIGIDHAMALRETPGLRLVAVCDQNPARLEEVRRDAPEARTYPTLDDILADDEVALAVVSTPPNTHAPIAERLLEAGKHVVVEKPFCLTTSEADRLMSLAERHRATLSVYQNRRWDADFLAIRRAIESGAIGEPFHIETFVGGFDHPCELWHSHEAISGGLFYDWGSHYLDWILTLVPAPVRMVSASAHKRVWHDVTNADMARVLVRFEGGIEAEFVHSDVAAALKPKWYILGTRGAIVADWRRERLVSRSRTGNLVEEAFQPAESPATVTVFRRDLGGAINAEQVQLPSPPRWAFHRNLADHLLDDEPLAVTPQQARRTVAVLEAAVWSVAHDAAPATIDDGGG